MGADDQILHLVWDDWNREHVQKHLVAPEEAEDAVFHASVRRSTYKNRLQVIGRTESGRTLSIIIGPVPGPRLDVNQGWRT